MALWAIYAARSWSGHTVAAILATLWVWNGIAYHYVFFAPINPAAYGFAALFVVQGLLFLGYGTVAGRLRFVSSTGWRGLLGLVLVAYATFAYTVLGYFLGHAWANLPIFGVAPCPTTIFTFGVLMLALGLAGAEGVPRRVRRARSRPSNIAGV